jgi:hypothetical protein
MAFAAAAPLVALKVAKDLAPAVLGGAGGALGGIFGKKGGRAGKAVGKAIGGSLKRVFKFRRGGRVHGTSYAYGGKVRVPPTAMRRGGVVRSKFKPGPRTCKCTKRRVVGGVRNRNGF